MHRIEAGLIDAQRMSSCQLKPIEITALAERDS